MRKNQYEEALFKCEDDQFEIDMIIDTNTSAIRILGKSIRAFFVFVLSAFILICGLLLRLSPLLPYVVPPSLPSFFLHFVQLPTYLPNYFLCLHSTLLLILPYSYPSSFLHSLTPLPPSLLHSLTHET